MTPSLTALVGFALWTMLLVFSLANVRILTTQRTGKALNSFLPDGSDMQGFAARLTRAHLNCLEFLPVFAAVILAAAVAGRSSVTDGLAMISRSTPDSGSRSCTSRPPRYRRYCCAPRSSWSSSSSRPGGPSS